MLLSCHCTKKVPKVFEFIRHIRMTSLYLLYGLDLLLFQLVAALRGFSPRSSRWGRGGEIRWKFQGPKSSKKQKNKLKIGGGKTFLDYFTYAILSLYELDQFVMNFFLLLNIQLIEYALRMEFFGSQSFPKMV